MPISHQNCMKVKKLGHNLENSSIKTNRFLKHLKVKFKIEANLWSEPEGQKKVFFLFKKTYRLIDFEFRSLLYIKIKLCCFSVDGTNLQQSRILKSWDFKK